MNMNLAGMHGLVLPENYTGDVKQHSVSAVCMYVYMYVTMYLCMYVYTRQTPRPVGPPLAQECRTQ